VTIDRGGSLRPRLLVAFSAVAAVSVVLLTVAALIGTDRGVNAVQQADRRQAAQRAAAAVAQDYQRAGGWAATDLAPAQSIADAAGAQLVVRDANMAMMWPGHAPANAGPGPLGASNADSESAPIVIDGLQVGTAVLIFGHTTPSQTGRSVAWIWVAVAAAGALVVAIAVSIFVARRLTRPLLAVTGAARAFARGDRTARSPTDGPGELGELARAFNTMADHVVRAEQTRRRLAADVAHELRTPLAALQAGLEELRDGLVDPRPARLGALHDQALRLSRVVGDLSQLSAAEAAALTLQPADADLAAIAADALAGQEPALRAAGLTITSNFDHPVPIRADADRMHQAVVNLLANAARYCRPGDTVTVRAFKSGNIAVVQVADTGPGIDPADLPHVFDRLWRGTTSATVTGSGIGLAVVRELVTAHCGTVDVDSPPGGGTTFTIALPLAAPKPVTAARQ
jgi:two-component system sensor histidine kinase BaeS